MKIVHLLPVYKHAIRIIIVSAYWLIVLYTPKNPSSGLLSKFIIRNGKLESKIAAEPKIVFFGFSILLILWENGDKMAKILFAKLVNKR